MFASLQEEGKALINNVIELVYFMRGAISYDDMMLRSPAERQLIEEFLLKRIETQKNSPHPVY